MKKYLFFIAVAIITSSTVQSQNTQVSTTKNTEKKTEVTTAANSPEEIQKKWADYMTPGEMHKWMAKMDGTWDADMTMWMSPDAPPMKTKGVAVYKMTLNGLYQESVHTADMGGMPFEGRSIMAYDNVKKIFISTWIDNMGSGIMTMEGSYDDKTKTYTSKGKGVDPIEGKEIEMREVVTFIDNDTQKVEMYCNKNGKEFKTMELIAKRRKI